MNLIIIAAILLLAGFIALLTEKNGGKRGFTKLDLFWKEASDHSHNDSEPSDEGKIQQASKDIIAEEKKLVASYLKSHSNNERF